MQSGEPSSGTPGKGKESEGSAGQFNYVNVFREFKRRLNKICADFSPEKKENLDQKSSSARADLLKHLQDPKLSFKDFKLEVFHAANRCKKYSIFHSDLSSALTKEILNEALFSIPNIDRLAQELAAEVAAGNVKQEDNAQEIEKYKKQAGKNAEEAEKQKKIAEEKAHEVEKQKKLAEEAAKEAARQKELVAQKEEEVTHQKKLQAETMNILSGLKGMLDESRAALDESVRQYQELSRVHEESMVQYKDEMNESILRIEQLQTENEDLRSQSVMLDAAGDDSFSANLAAYAEKQEQAVHAAGSASVNSSRTSTNGARSNAKADKSHRTPKTDMDKARVVMGAKRFNAVKCLVEYVRGLQKKLSSNEVGLFSQEALSVEQKQGVVLGIELANRLIFLLVAKLDSMKTADVINNYLQKYTGVEGKFKKCCIEGRDANFKDDENITVLKDGGKVALAQSEKDKNYCQLYIHNSGGWLQKNEVYFNYFNARRKAEDITKVDVPGAAKLDGLWNAVCSAEESVGKKVIANGAGSA